MWKWLLAVEQCLMSGLASSWISWHRSSPKGTTHPEEAVPDVSLD